jgi:hypothetical protein
MNLMLTYTVELERRSHPLTFMIFNEKTFVRLSCFFAWCALHSRLLWSCSTPLCLTLRLLIAYTAFCICRQSVLHARVHLGVTQFSFALLILLACRSSPYSFRMTSPTYFIPRTALFWAITQRVLVNFLPTFRYNLWFPSSRVKNPRIPSSSSHLGTFTHSLYLPWNCCMFEGVFDICY